MTKNGRDPVLIGAGQTTYEKVPEHASLWYVVQAARLALQGTGLTTQDVDGLGVCSFRMGSDNTATVAEQLGITPHWGFWGGFGSGSPVIGVNEAAEAVRRGDANVVVLTSGDSYTVNQHFGLMDDFNTGMRDYLNPYGVGGPNGLFAMLERRHAHEFGTRKEQLGKLAVTQRANAALNENALLRDPMTINDYLTSRLIADPIRLYDCVLPCGGGDAVVISTRERAKSLGLPYVEILAGGMRLNHDPHSALMLEGGWADFTPGMLAKAGLTHDDVDMLQYYDDYPIMGLIQIEGLGFCDKGEGGQFVEDTDLSRTGDLAINTGGGQLSCGQAGEAGGLLGVTEAFSQLLGRAGERQVTNHETAIVSGFGMIGYVKGTVQSAVVLAAGK